MTRQAFTVRAAAAALFIGLLAVPAHAQRAHIGPHGGFNSGDDNWLVGAQMLFPVARHVELYPSFDYYFENGATLMAFSGDVKLRFPVGGGTAPYFGGGINVLHSSNGLTSGTDTGWDLVFGLESRRGATHPYVEGRLLQHDASRFQLAAGLNITLY
jgi:hypothetical protein